MRPLMLPRRNGVQGKGGRWQDIAARLKSIGGKDQRDARGRIVGGSLDHAPQLALDLGGGVMNGADAHGGRRSHLAEGV